MGFFLRDLWADFKHSSEDSSKLSKIEWIHSLIHLTNEQTFSGHCAKLSVSSWGHVALRFWGLKILMLWGDKHTTEGCVVSFTFNSGRAERTMQMIFVRRRSLGHLPDDFLSSFSPLEDMSEWCGRGRGPLGRQCGVRKRAQAMQLSSHGFQYPILPFGSYLTSDTSPLRVSHFFMGKKAIIYIKYIEQSWI